MTRANARAAHDEILIVRIFDGPRALVFRNWIEPESAAEWFAPEGFRVTSCEIDARSGGRWRVAYRSQDGDAWVEVGEFREVVEPEKLVFSLTQQGARGSGPETLVTVIFADRGAKTEMTFRQTGFESSAQRDGNAEGWEGCFRKLDAQLAAGGRGFSGDEVDSRGGHHVR